MIAEGLTYKMPLEVYLQAAVIRGILETNQSRLSSHLILREGDEVLMLRAASLNKLDRTTIAAGSDEYLIYMQEIFLIADLSPQAERFGIENLFVKKESSRALLSVGPYWLQGNIHILPGGALHDLLMATTRFVPVTEATLLDRPEKESRTYLVNRTKIGFITALNESLSEL
jgi:uncharacterized protein DUF6812